MQTSKSTWSCTPLQARPGAHQVRQPVKYPATNRCSGLQHGVIRDAVMLLSPFCPFSSGQILGLKATVALLLTMLIKAKIRITAFSALGIFLLLLQTLVFLAAGGGLVLAAGGAALFARQQRRSQAA